MSSWLRRNLPGFEKQVNRARNWDWLSGGWDTGKLAGWLLAGLGALGGYVYAMAQGLPGALVALVVAGILAAVMLGLNQGTQLWARYRARAEPQTSPTKGEASNAHPLRLEFGGGPGFDGIDPHAGLAIRRVVSFALVNDGDGFIADCAVRFRSFIPPPSSAVFAPGALLRDGIDLPPGQRRFVKLACYDENFPTGYISQKIGLCAPPDNSLGGGDGSLVIDEEVRSHEIFLEASAPGVPAVLERITLSVYAKGRLRLGSHAESRNSDPAMSAAGLCRMIGRQDRPESSTARLWDAAAVGRGGCGTRPPAPRSKQPMQHAGEVEAAAFSPGWGAGGHRLLQWHGAAVNRYELEGSWTREGETLVLRSERGRLWLCYSAAKVHFVAAATDGATDGATVRVRSGAEEWRSIRIGWPALYTIVDGDAYAEQMVELEAMSPGLTLYSATFG